MDDAPSEQEKFYDETIAPELLRLGRLCKERGIPFLALVNPEGKMGRTSFGLKEWSMLHLAQTLALCGCLDSFMFHLVRHYPKGQPHSSILLSKLGIDPQTGQMKPPNVV